MREVWIAMIRSVDSGRADSNHAESGRAASRPAQQRDSVTDHRWVAGVQYSGQGGSRLHVTMFQLGMRSTTPSLLVLVWSLPVADVKLVLYSIYSNLAVFL